METDGKNRFLDKKSTQIAYFGPYRGHIHNPGMGIISMAVSDHMVTGYTPADRAAADRENPFSVTKNMLKAVTDLRYIDNLYIRVGWNDVQKEAGKLTLSPEFQMAVEAAEEAGISWGFRIMQASPSNPSEHLLPEFLADKLPMLPFYDGSYYGPFPKKLPLYTDEYLKYWDEMLHLLGERFDKNPSLEYGDISGFGLWGEGHHGCHVTPGGPVEDLDIGTPERLEFVLQSLIGSHLDAFPSTPMVLNLILTQYEAGRRSVQDGCWVRRDSYYHWFEARHAEAGLLRRPDTAMIFETVMPGMAMHDDPDPAFRQNYLEIPAKMCEYGAAYGIVGFNPLDTLFADHMVPQLYDAFKQRIGYRLRPSIVWKAKEPDGSLSLALGMVNDGCVCPPGDITFFAESNGRRSSVTVNGGSFAGKMYIVELPLPEGHDDGVTLSMEIRMKGKVQPVRFAADIREQEAPYHLLLLLNH